MPVEYKACQKVLSGGGMCGYWTHNHPAECKPFKKCDKCKENMDPDAPLDSCKKCEPEMHAFFAEEMKKLEHAEMIPPPDVKEDPMQLLLAWHIVEPKIAKLADQMAPLIKEEQELRRKIVDLLYPDSDTEGVQYHPLEQGYRLKSTVKIDRKIDETMVPFVKEQLSKQLVNANAIFVDKPQFVLKAYRELSEEIKKIVKQALTEKRAMPTMEIVPPEEK